MFILNNAIPQCTASKNSLIEITFHSIVLCLNVFNAKSLPAYMPPRFWNRDIVTPYESYNLKKSYQANKKKKNRCVERGGKFVLLKETNMYPKILRFALTKFTEEFVCICDSLAETDNIQFFLIHHCAQKCYYCSY